MNKEEFVKNLKNVKLVIGNGFDLHCGLHTTYSDYYCQNWRKYRFIQNISDDYSDGNRVIDFSDAKIDSLNVWDVFFALNSSKDPYSCRKFWCDIEQLILSSLLSTEEVNKKKDLFSLFSLASIHWPDLLEKESKNTSSSNDKESFVSGFILNRMKKLQFNISNYYDFLLGQLNEFESSFGKFIYYQIHDKYFENANFGKYFFNTMYLYRIEETLNQLCLIKQIVDIDSFNYSHFYLANDNITINHINGSHLNPIFGIDSIFEPNDPRFIFTKTSRRIESNIINEDFCEKADYENLIVFGHSLNEADYSYFFPIFDKLNLLSHGSKGKLIFAFSIYELEKEVQIKSSLRKSISDMILTYAKEKRVTNPNRFLDMISTQGKVIFYEIPEIKNSFHFMSDSFEDRWKKMLEDMDKNIDK